MLVLIFCKNYKNILLTGFFTGLVFVFLFNALPAKADFSTCGITPTAPLWQAKASDGTVVMTVDSVGNLDIAATTVQTNTAPPASGLTNSFIIKKSTTNKFVFNKTNAYITGAVLENQASLPAASGDDLVVNNSSGAAVAIFDATTGNIYIKGAACGIGPIEITNCQQLQNIQNNLTGSYILKNNIDCTETITWNSGAGFNPIGVFTGIFDGQNYTVSNLYINRSSLSGVGLFSIAGVGAEIKNVGLVSVNIRGGNNTGGLAGENRTNIFNCYATGNIHGGTYVGGLVGYSTTAGVTISNSYSTSNITGTGYVGGLVGISSAASILTSYAAGNVVGSSNYVGGLVGSCAGGSILKSYASGSVAGSGYVGGLVGLTTASISNSYADGNITGNSAVGGLIGRISGGSVSNSYSVGTVAGTTYVGGFAGYRSAGTFSSSYWNNQTSGQTIGCGYGTCTGVTGKTIGEMAQEATFTGWTFQPPVTDIWKLSAITPVDRYYPCLSWQVNATCIKAPLLIFTCEDLQKIGNDSAYPLNGNYILSNNIDCAKTDPSNSGNAGSIWDDAGSTYGTGGTGFEPIGWDSPFTGTFDGKGYQIQNLYINRPTNSFVGLFSYANSATIKNLGVTVASILGGTYTGALLGICNAWCDIDSVYSISTSTGSVAVDSYWGGFVGGLAGEIRDSSLINSYSTVPVTGTYIVGGLVGYNNNSSIISNSYASGIVIGNNNSVGGLAGRNNGTIINSYAISNVAGAQYYEAGGLVGLFEGGTISKSYVVGAVYGASYKGGLVGTYYTGGIFSDSYWNTEISGLSNICGSGSCAGAVGKTTGQMILQSTYPTWTFMPTASADWKQSTLTPVANGYFPCLSWQNENTCFCQYSLPSIAGKDTDGDGTEDRMDYCYENPAETVPKLCSCTDSFSPNSCCHPCDLTGDGVVNFLDVTAFQNEIGKPACKSTRPWLDGYSLPSVPRNGFIDALDYQGWNNRCYIQC